MLTFKQHFIQEKFEGNLKYVHGGTFYHITPLQNLKTIEKYGLVPKPHNISNISAKRLKNLKQNLATRFNGKVTYLPAVFLFDINNIDMLDTYFKPFTFWTHIKHYVAGIQRKSKEFAILQVSLPPTYTVFQDPLDLPDKKIFNWYVNNKWFVNKTILPRYIKPYDTFTI